MAIGTLVQVNVNNKTYIGYVSGVTSTGAPIVTYTTIEADGSERTRYWYGSLLINK